MDRGATEEEVFDMMIGMGFKKENTDASGKDYYWKDSSGRYFISDLKPENVLKTKSGYYAVIDADIKMYDHTKGIEFNYQGGIGLSNAEFNREADIYSNRNEDSEVVGNVLSEFNTDEITYDEPVSNNLSEAFSNEEWNDIFDELIDRNPMMANMANQGLFSRQELMQMFSESEETNQTILEEIRRGLDDGSVKPMTIDENQEDIPLCM